MTDVGKLPPAPAPYVPPPGVDPEMLKKLQSGDPTAVMEAMSVLAGNKGGPLGHLSETQVLEMLAALAKTAGSGTSGAGSNNGTEGVTNPNGSPAIDGVQFDFSPEDMAMALQALQGKTQQSQLDVAKQGLTMNEVKLTQKHKEALEKLQAILDKSKEASDKGKAQDVLGWIGRIAGVIAAGIAVAIAVAATVASFGAGAPLLVLAVAGAVGAVMGLASAISQEAGGPALEFSTLISKAITSSLEAGGMDKKEAEAKGKLVSGLVGLATGLVLADPAFAGQIAGGAAALANPNDPMAAAIWEGAITAAFTIAICVVSIVLSAGAATGKAVDGIAKTVDTAKKMSDTVMTGAKIAQGAVGIASGAVAVGAGTLGILKSVDEFDMSNLQSGKAKIDAMIMKLGKQMEEDREDIKKVMDQIMEGMNLVSQILAGAAQSRSQLSSNLAGKGQTI